MAVRPFSVLSLCTGIAGLDIGLRLAVPHARTVCMVEREAFCVAHLVEQMRAGRLDECPVWSDASTFDGGPWRGRVDCVTGGYPCQPFSHAGRRLGAGDARHLWPHVRRIIRDTDAPMAFLENVRGHVTLGLRDVLEDLAADGFDAEWIVLRASDVGAPHLRARVFILAHRRGHGFDYGPQRHGEARRVEAVGDTIGPGLEGHARDGSDRAGRPQPHGPARPAGLRPLFPPGQDDYGGWLRWLDAGGPEPAVRRDADGIADRVDRLRALGNGVVPLQAAVAFRVLADRAGLTAGETWTASKKEPA